MKSRSDVELLAELEKDLAELQTTINVMKRRMGVTSSGNNNSSHAPTQDENRGQDKPYLGMNILSASRKYLQRVKEPRTPAEIAEALRTGGVHSRSKDFNGIVRTTLFKGGGEVGIESFGSGKWGLADWRPGRSRTGQDAGEQES